MPKNNIRMLLDKAFFACTAYIYLLYYIGTGFNFFFIMLKDTIFILFYLFATVGCQILKGRVGRHRTNLYDIIVKKDLFKRQIY